MCTCTCYVQNLLIQCTCTCFLLLAVEYKNEDFALIQFFLAPKIDDEETTQDILLIRYTKLHYIVVPNILLLCVLCGTHVHMLYIL